MHRVSPRRRRVVTRKARPAREQRIGHLQPSCQPPPPTLSRRLCAKLQKVTQEAEDSKRACGGTESRTGSSSGECRDSMYGCSSACSIVMRFSGLNVSILSSRSSAYRHSPRDNQVYQQEWHRNSSMLLEAPQTM